VRIVGGVAKGRRLVVPAKGTRPTSERAREALFNSLRSLLDVEGARVLDLFAGSGAVGLEALSRGAAAATFVESDRTAVAILRRNVATVGLPGASVLARPAASVLAVESETPYDLVFADPPYAMSDADLSVLLRRLADGRWLAEDAVVIVERSARDEPLAWPDGVAPVMNRRYGEGQLWYGRPR
jgi:16S rRNA (guanine966-N2)-methyltransferase